MKLFAHWLMCRVWQSVRLSAEFHRITPNHGGGVDGRP